MSCGLFLFVFCDSHIVVILNNFHLVLTFVYSLKRVFKGSDEVRLMRPPSPICQTPDTQQETEKGPAPMEPDTTQPGTSREVTDNLVTMLR